MAADKFAKVEAGDPLRIPAETYNTLVDVARAFLAGQHDRLSEGARGQKQTTIIKVQNDSGANRNAYEVLKLDGVVFSETDNLPEFQVRAGFKGIVPAAATDTVCILLEPCAAGAYARAVIAGIATVQVNVTDEAHGFANPTAADATKLTSGATGLHRILYKPAGTGTKWCKVRLADAGAGGGGSDIEFVKCTSATATGSLYPGVLQDVNSSTGALTDSSSGTLTPNSTDTGADTVSFASSHGWTTGMLVQPATTGGGLTAGTQYWINAVDSDTISFHTSLADAEAGSNKVNLTGTIFSALDQVGVWLRFPNDEVPTDGTKYSAVPVGSTGGVAILEGLSAATVFPICQGRLSENDSDPVIFTDSGGNITTLFLVRYNGSRITLYNGTSWQALTIPFGPPSVAVPATNFRRFDVFAYNNGGAVALETVNWNESTGAITGATTASPVVITSTGHGLSSGEMVGISGVDGLLGVNGNVFYVANPTANTFELNPSTGTSTYTSGGTWHRLKTSRATTLVAQDGVKVKNGDPTRLYLGTCLTLLGATHNNYHRRLIANYFNRVPRIIRGGSYTLGAFAGTAAVWKFPQATSAGGLMIVSPDRATVQSGQPEANLFIDLRCTVGFDCDTAGEYLLNSFSINGQGGPGTLATIETQIPGSTDQVLIASSHLRNVAALDAVSLPSGVFLINAMCAPSSSGATYTLRDLADEASAETVTSVGFHGTILN